MTMLYWIIPTNIVYVHYKLTLGLSFLGQRNNKKPWNWRNIMRSVTDIFLSKVFFSYGYLSYYCLCWLMLLHIAFMAWFSTILEIVKTINLYTNVFWDKHFSLHIWLRYPSHRQTCKNSECPQLLHSHPSVLIPHPAL